MPGYRLVGHVAVLMSAALAHAHPGIPTTKTIAFRQGNDAEIAVGTTIGLLLSHDGGASWSWMCEAAVHYQGLFVPDYAYRPNGTLFATTHDGLLANRDGCTFAPTPLGSRLISTIALDPTAALHVAAADTMDGNVYVTRDDAMTFSSMTMPAMLNDWWSTIRIAPSDPDVVYLAGYRLTPPAKDLLLYRSSDGGKSFEVRPTTAFAGLPGADLQIGGVSSSDPDLVFARVISNDNTLKEWLYRSRDGGMTWIQILANDGPLAFIVRNNGDLVAGSRFAGAWVSHDSGDTWLALSNAPHISCLVESALEELWACTANFGSMGIPADGAAVMKTTDLTTWTPVLRFQDIAGPVDCPSGTLAHACREIWCEVKLQAAITSEVIDCSTPDAGIPMPVDDPPPGCCSTTSSSPEGVAMWGAGVLWSLAARRRRRASSRDDRRLRASDSDAARRPVAASARARRTNRRPRIRGGRTAGPDDPSRRVAG